MFTFCSVSVFRQEGDHIDCLSHLFIVLIYTDLNSEFPDLTVFEHVSQMIGLTNLNESKHTHWVDSIVDQNGPMKLK